MSTIKLLQRGAGLALAASFLIPASRLPATSLCPFRLLTGFPCPGCGLTHAFCNISHGHFKMAWQANPFGFLFYAAGHCFRRLAMAASEIPGNRSCNGSHAGSGVGAGFTDARNVGL